MGDGQTPRHRTVTSIVSLMESIILFAPADHRRFNGNVQQFLANAIDPQKGTSLMTNSCWRGKFCSCKSEQMDVIVSLPVVLFFDTSMQDKSQCWTFPDTIQIEGESASGNKNKQYYDIVSRVFHSDDHFTAHVRGIRKTVWSYNDLNGRLIPLKLPYALTNLIGSKVSPVLAATTSGVFYRLRNGYVAQQAIQRRIWRRLREFKHIEIVSPPSPNENATCTLIKDGEELEVRDDVKARWRTKRTEAYVEYEVKSQPTADAIVMNGADNTNTDARHAADNATLTTSANSRPDDNEDENTGADTHHGVEKGITDVQVDDHAAVEHVTTLTPSEDKNPDTATQHEVATAISTVKDVDNAGIEQVTTQPQLPETVDDAGGNSRSWTYPEQLPWNAAQTVTQSILQTLEAIRKAKEASQASVPDDTHHVKARADVNSQAKETKRVWPSAPTFAPHPVNIFKDGSNIQGANADQTDSTHSSQSSIDRRKVSRARRPSSVHADDVPNNESRINCRCGFEGEVLDSRLEQPLIGCDTFYPSAPPCHNWSHVACQTDGWTSFMTENQRFTCPSCDPGFNLTRVDFKQ